MNSFMRTKNFVNDKSMNESCTIYFEDKNCDTQDLEYSLYDIKRESRIERYSGNSSWQNLRFEKFISTVINYRY